jgi:phosphatidylglycerol:prolipoprotein diacylglycerol transferase
LPTTDQSNAIAWTDLHLDPVALHLGFFDLRWYSLAYLAGIFIGYWYLLKLLAKPGAPMARRHADDLVFYAALGIILGGRIGYVLFYNLGYYAQHPVDVLKLWDGGMSFHGGLIGTVLGILYLSWKEKLPALRIHDYVACVAPIGLFYGIFRFLVEFVREPDPQLTGFAHATGLHMGQWLSLPLIIGGAGLLWTAKARRVRVEPTLGSASVS